MRRGLSILLADGTALLTAPHMLRVSSPQLTTGVGTARIDCIRQHPRVNTQRLRQISCNANSCPQTSVCVREARTDDELEACANIRASAFYEELPVPRYVINLKRQFAREEFQGLVKRTRNVPGEGPPKAVCFVALNEEKCVVGCGDIRPPFSKTGLQPTGVPQDPNAAFLVNVAVDRKQRRRGFGSALLQQALIIAQKQLQADRVYTHVDGTNPATVSLYKRAGFRKSCCTPEDMERTGIIVLVAEVKEELPE